jgi:putative serine/threonine protein kinase
MRGSGLKKAFVVPVEKLTHEKAYGEILSYPKHEKAELAKRVRELQKLRVKALVFKGEKRISGLNVLGKGCVGIVLIAYVDKKKAALKVRRLDADRLKMRREAEMLEKANSARVGPRLLGFTRNLLLMQFIDGCLLPVWLEKPVGKMQVEKVMREVLEQCWRLDAIGLDHGELSHAPKHIIIDRKDRPFIVDFETSSVNRAAANVTSICQFLFISGIAGKVTEKIGGRDKKAIVEALRFYKKHGNRESFEMVLEACGLQTT